MKVMLVKDVTELGRAGDIKEVADGYGRNFLIPRKLAVQAHSGIDAEARRIREAAERKEAKQRQAALELAGEIGDKTVVVTLKVGAEDKAFGSVTSEDIANAIMAQHQLEVDKRRIHLPEPIKQLGEHQVRLHLWRDVDAVINLIVSKAG